MDEREKEIRKWHMDCGKIDLEIDHLLAIIDRQRAEIKRLEEEAEDEHQDALMRTEWD